MTLVHHKITEIPTFFLPGRISDVDYFYLTEILYVLKKYCTKHNSTKLIFSDIKPLIKKNEQLVLSVVFCLMI